MSQVNQTVCDVCGRAKAEVNHWYVLGTVTCGGFVLLRADEIAEGCGGVIFDRQDVCGQECAHKALTAWLNGGAT